MTTTPIAHWMQRNGLNVTRAAIVLDVSKATASKWKDGLQKIPAEKVGRVSELTGIPREELRPDVFGPIHSEAAQ